MAEKVDIPVADLTGAPFPTNKTLRRRQGIFWQFTRFIVFNLRIMRMIVKGEH